MTAGILLAAGKSRRMGADCKLLLPAGDETLVRRSARALLAAGLSPVVVVLGHRSGEVEQALTELPLQFVTNPRFPEGMGTSLAAGIAALPRTAQCVVIALGDMPDVRPDTIPTLLQAATDRGIAAPEFEGRRGHPVAFDLPTYRNLLEALDGDQGARTILDNHPDDVVRVPVDDPGVLMDLDTPEQYDAWMRKEPT